MKNTGSMKDIVKENEKTSQRLGKNLGQNIYLIKNLHPNIQRTLGAQQ